jgi:2,4-dienoyl-CoA reductase-like NADH-dependent reductase (Old Yellow Enzyme family)
MRDTALFRPFRYKNLALDNRIAMAPMTRYLSPEGIPAADAAAYYSRRAAGGVGLIITEGVGIDREAARRDPNVPNFFGEDALREWSKVFGAVRAAGASIVPQLWHVGASPARDPSKPETPRESPSALFGDGPVRGRAMSDRDIASTIEAYASAAENALRLGAAGVEIHAAHGYLIDQFFWNVTNRRNDKFGGADIAARTRFGVEVVKAVRARVGPDFPIIFRISQWKIPDYDNRLVRTPSELESWLRPLRDAGVDIFHCSQRRFWNPEFEGSSLNLAGWVKKLMDCPTISVGSVGLSVAFLDPAAQGPIATANVDALIDRLEREEFDLIAVGRALISEPQWAAKVRTGHFAALKPYNPADLATLT